MINAICGEEERDAAQSMASDLARETKVRQRARATLQRVRFGKLRCWFPCFLMLISLLLDLLDVKAELLHTHAPGAQAPEVHGQLSGYGHNGFLPCRSCGG